MSYMNSVESDKELYRFVKSFEVRHRLSYGAAFYARAIPALLRPHRLETDAPRHYRANFTLDDAQFAAWAELFGVPAAERLPFTYANTSATMILMQILTDLGVNFKYVRHLRCDLALPVQPYQPGVEYSLMTDVRPPVRLRPDRVAVVTDTDVVDPFGNRVARQTDVWCILGIAPHHVERVAVPRDPAADSLKGLSRQKARLAPDGAAPIAIAPDLGRRYGWVSGDLNPTHLSRAAARLFGSRDAFIQGFCTVNLLIAALHQLGRNPARLSTTLVRPVYVAQTALLRASDDVLELCDAEGALLASASWVARD